MTSKNSDWNKQLNKPFLLKPVGKDYLWGGYRLNEDFSKGIYMDSLAETWECSTHPDGISVVDSGEFCGLTLANVLERHSEFLGTNCIGSHGLPIIIKLIDADKDLSVQVHPDDSYAKENENGESGKTEMWYILDAQPDSSIVYGVSQDLSKEEFLVSAESGRVEEYLQKIPVKKNDIFFIPAGTIHAIGKGVLVAEIQESSNLTYRIFDYNRVDKTGEHRELHLAKAADVADLHRAGKPLQPMRVLNYSPGCAKELLCRCAYFQVERMLVNTERIRSLVGIRTSSLSFETLLCIDGCGSVSFDNESYNFFKGDCIFVPADSVCVHIHGVAQFIKVSC